MKIIINKFIKDFSINQTVDDSIYNQYYLEFIPEFVEFCLCSNVRWVTLDDKKKIFLNQLGSASLFLKEEEIINGIFSINIYDDNKMYYIFKFGDCDE